MIIQKVKLSSIDLKQIQKMALEKVRGKNFHIDGAF